MLSVPHHAVSKSRCRRVHKAAMAHFMTSARHQRAAVSAKASTVLTVSCMRLHPRPGHRLHGGCGCKPHQPLTRAQHETCLLQLHAMVTKRRSLESSLQEQRTTGARTSSSSTPLVFKTSLTMGGLIAKVCWVSRVPITLNESLILAALAPA